jgi:hypothetical protein
VVSGTAGELLTSLVLATCVDKAVARRAASGWRGDAYSVLARPSHEVALSWLTTWDDEPSAKQFEETLSGLWGCWAKSPALGEFHMGKGWVVRRSGTRVALVRGLGEGSEDALHALLQVPITPRPAIPLAGAPPIVPIRPKSDAPAGSVNGARYVNPRLGVLSDAPPGFSSTLGAGAMSLTIKREGGSIGTIELSDELPNEAMHRSLFALLERAFAKGADHRFFLEKSGEGTVTSTFGPAFERDYTVPGTLSGMRVVIIPLCRGTGSLVLTTFWLNEDDQRLLGQWLANTVPISAQDPPICADLDP